MSDTEDHRLRTRRRKVLVGTSVLAVTTMVSSLALWSGSAEVDAEIETANFHLEINTDVDRGFPEDSWQSVSTLSLSDVVSGEEATLWAPGSEAESDFMMRLNPGTTHSGHIPPEGLVVDSDDAEGYAWELHSEEAQFNEPIIGGQSAIADNAERSAAGEPMVTETVLFEPIAMDAGEEYLFTMKITATDEVPPKSVYAPSWEFFATLGEYEGDVGASPEPSEPEEPRDTLIRPPTPVYSASSNTVQIPTHPGVIYSHTETVDVPLEGLVVTAVPAEGYRFNETAVTRWEFDYTFRDVTPREPERQDDLNLVRVWPTSGVTYSHTGEVVIPPGGLEITAEANEGHRIAEGATDTWFFEYQQQPSFTEWSASPISNRALATVYVGDDFILASGNYGEVYRSEDDGETWSRSDSGIRTALNVTIRSIVSTTNDRIVAIGSGDMVWISDDQGSSWSTVSKPRTINGYGADSDGSRIVSVGFSGAAMLSDDSGQTWRELTTPTTSVLYSAAVEGDRIVTVGQNGTVLISHDAGQTWHPVDAGVGATHLFSVDMSGDLIIISGNNGTLSISEDGGQTWGRPNISNTTRIVEVRIDGDHVVAINEAGLLLYSDDRTRTWNEASIGSIREGNMTAVSSTGDRVYAVSSRGNIYYADR